MKNVIYLHPPPTLPYFCKAMFQIGADFSTFSVQESTVKHSIQNTCVFAFPFAEFRASVLGHELHTAPHYITWHDKNWQLATLKFQFLILFPFI